jgi:hypothetical protein
LDRYLTSLYEPSFQQESFLTFLIRTIHTAPTSRVEKIVFQARKIIDMVRRSLEKLIAFFHRRTLTLLSHCPKGRTENDNKAFPFVPRQGEMLVDPHALDRAGHFRRIPYPPSIAYSDRATEDIHPKDSRDEVPHDKHRRMQFEDQGMYMEPGQGPSEQYHYFSNHHLQHEGSHVSYYYHHGMSVHPYWQQGDQGSIVAPPQYPSNAHHGLGEGHEHCQDYRHLMKAANTGTSVPRTVPLFMSCDHESLSEYQCLIRKQIELFCATNSDIELTVQGRNRHIEAGQVGVRCRHCAHLPVKKRARGAVYYPSKLSCIYQAAQNMATVHLSKHCTLVPSYIRAELLKKDRKSSAGSGKEYWAVGARTQGVVEFDGRLWFEHNVLAAYNQHGFGHFGQH